MYLNEDVRQFQAETAQLPETLTSTFKYIVLEIRKGNKTNFVENDKEARSTWI